MCIVLFIIEKIIYLLEYKIMRFFGLYRFDEKYVYFSINKLNKGDDVFKLIFDFVLLFWK